MTALQQPKVLVIDDKISIRKAVQLILQDSCKVREAASGREGLRILQDTAINIVFLDVEMPEMDGIETLQKIKEFDSRIEVCMLTASSDTLLEEKARQSGAFAWLGKPVEVEALRQLVRGLTDIINEKEKIHLARKTLQLIKQKLEPLINNRSSTIFEV